MTDEDGAQALTYLDSSAIVKLILPEPESGALSEFLAGRNLVSSRLGEIESRRAIMLTGSDEEVTAREQEVLDSIDLIEISPTIASDAAGLEPPALRTLDAIHLATALALGEDLDCVVVYDHRLAAATRERALNVQGPQ
ncbi:MAG: type II toxin-antitoxin system VapC family toxin [Actinomycetota bacterium]